MIILSSLFLFSINSGQAQGEAEVNDGFSKAVYQHELHGPFFYHRVVKGETLYRISKRYHVTAARIMTLNRMSNSDLSIEQRLRIPLNREELSWDEPTHLAHLKLYYRVRPKETLFRICRVYFDRNSKDLKKANGIRKNRLDVNQKLFIGYLGLKRDLPSPLMDSIHVQPINPMPDSSQEEKPLVLDSGELESEIKVSLPEPEETELTYQSGAAFWDKDQRDRGGMYVLHKDAKLNSWIEIVNPMFDEKLVAKVVGNIPPDIYPEDVMIIVSPAIAKKLKAIDARFYVKVRYLRAKPILTNQ
jgi:LysM repeat protein